MMQYVSRRITNSEIDDSNSVGLSQTSVMEVSIRTRFTSSTAMKHTAGMTLFLLLSHSLYSRFPLLFGFSSFFIVDPVNCQIS